MWKKGGCNNLRRARDDLIEGEHAELEEGVVGGAAHVGEGHACQHLRRHLSMHPARNHLQ